MIKNPIKFIRNPNSPEAIQARLDGYEVNTPYEKHHFIDDPTAPSIMIDYTTEGLSQRVNYTITGGDKHFSKRLVRSSVVIDNQGRAILTSYFVDTRNNQWVVTKSLYNNTPPSSPEISPNIPFPRPSYGGTFGGFNSSARGEVWRNEGRSSASLREIQKRLFSNVDLDPNANNDKHQPTDEYQDDFDGIR
jgi:hypothetical protein